MEYIYKRAGMEDIELLVGMRMEVLRAANCLGAGGVSFFRVMPTYHNPTGRKAYIMNMYTCPDHRRRGIAYHTLELLVEEAVKRGVKHITLEATDMGRPLYERYGFVNMDHEMELSKVLTMDDLA